MENLKFFTIDDLDNYLQDNLYLNRTADPTNVKYLYGDMLRQMEFFRQFTVDKRNFSILAYDRKYYYRANLLEVFPDNASLSFKNNFQKISLRDLLEIDAEMKDNQY